LCQEARTRLWNVFYTDFYVYNFECPDDWSGKITVAEAAKRYGRASQFLENIWTELWHRKVHLYPGQEEMMQAIDRVSIGSCQWDSIFDILEEIFRQHRPGYWIIDDGEETAQKIRVALEGERTVYTFVGGRFVDRMTPDEVKSIEQVLRSQLEAVRDHFKAAVRLLSDRKNPDYRNSIKQSISAVEAACKHLTGLQNATLGQALNELDKRRPLHPDFKESLQRLYNWTSDSAGIRHAIKDQSNVESADAQFMLVTCSAFVNYLFER
jgi:hypothetical protein